MFCSQCGSGIEEAAKFCSKCGNAIKPTIVTPNHSVATEGASIANSTIDITNFNKEFIESPLFNKLIKSNVDYYRTAFLKISPYLNLSTIELQTMGTIERLKKLSSFNWAAGLFGSFWMAYRKSYMNALYITAIEFGFGLMWSKHGSGIDVVGTFLQFILLFIVVGFFGNNMYYAGLTSKLKKAKSELDLEDIGGTSVLMALAFLGLNIFIELMILGISAR